MPSRVSLCTITPIPPGIPYDVEVWENWTAPGAPPDLQGISIHWEGWYLSRPAASASERLDVIRALWDDLCLIRRTPEEYHDHLQILCHSGDLEQAVEIARALVGEE